MKRYFETVATDKLLLLANLVLIGLLILSGYSFRDALSKSASGTETEEMRSLEAYENVYKDSNESAL